MKRKTDIQLIEAMILSNKVLLTEAPCVFPPDWNADLGNKFRVWFRQTYEQEAVKLDLDETGPYNNATVLKAFCYNPYGLETAGSKFMKTDADLGGGDDDWQVLGLNGWEWLGIIAAVAIIGGLAWWKFRKIKMGARLAKQAAEEAKNYPGGKAQMLEDAIGAAKDKSKRREFLSKFLKSKNLSKAEQEAAEKAMMNPGYITAEQKFMRQMALDEFKQGNITAKELIRINKLKGEDAKMIRAIDRARKKTNNKTAWPSKDQLKNWKTKQTNKTTNAPKRTYKPIENSKLTYYTNPKSTNFENAWFHLKGSVTPDDVETAINRTMTQMGVSFKQSAQLRNTASLSAEAISKQLSSKGNFMLAKHANAQTFPPFNTWMREMNAAGVKPQVSPGDMARYAKNHTIWNLIHRR